MTVSTIDVVDATGTTRTVNAIRDPGRAVAAASSPVALSTEDKTALDAVNTAIGAQADAAWSGTGSGSAIAVLKALWGKLAATLTVAKGQQATATATIASSGTTSGAVDLGVARAVGLVMPATFTGTTLTFQSSYDGTNFSPVYDISGNQVSVTCAASRRIVLSPAQFYGIRHLKIVSGATEAASRDIVVVAEA